MCEILLHVVHEFLERRRVQPFLKLARAAILADDGAVDGASETPNGVARLHCSLGPDAKLEILERSVLYTCRTSAEASEQSAEQFNA